ncbi:MAG TPA: NAD(P)-dependent oxidoreductase [Burkholderiales bacterium]|nr:NAD(P)-dependent oxidoreductase [Burkholderiales bacterium]
MRVAVTGAGGRVGSALVASLARHRELDVVALVRNALAASLLGAPDAEIRVGSVTDPAASREALAGCDAVVNCALAKGWPSTARQQNEAILRNIAAAPDVRRVVHFSSVAVYGMCVDPRVSTFAQPRPDSSYGVDKLREERLAARLFGARQIHHHVVRLGHVYGPSQWVSRDVLERVRDPAFALPFGGENPSNAVSIEAVAAAVRGLLRGDQPSGVRNLFDAPQSSWRTLYDLHTRLLARPPADSLAEAESLALRERYYAAARQPLRNLVRGALGSLGSVNLVALAQSEAFRYLVHGPLLLLPSPVGAALNRAYVRRKARSALAQGAPPARTLPSALMCAPAVPGPCFPTLDSREATAAMAEELGAWLHGLWSYRWDACALGRAERGAGTRPMAVAGSR